ncbi:glycoside hydrolase family 38 C-terminal domain-containing protein [Paenibacillus alginolyticus]|uniref:glycoside hydrolase family 38 C-terminal domain-containing protein n=1 Tax=Paenibacillus alginolyticus TaxID=59839 RepID=UPI0028AC0F6D|nr:glycoside hydrolase family 38 C-terminal domain-containing protein [Paenibacillus frigoriresistens]
MTNLPSMGFAAIRYEKTAVSQATMAEAVSFYSLAQGIETPFYILQWNNHGQLTRIYDKQAAREVLKAQEAGNVFEVFEDKPKSRMRHGISISTIWKKEGSSTTARRFRLLKLGLCALSFNSRGRIWTPS